MKAKTIKIVLAKKINDWIKSIEDESVRNIAKKSVIVTGGCITSMLLREEVNDFDIYFSNKAAALAVTNYYVEKFKNGPSNTFKNGSKKIDMWVEDQNDRIKIIIKSAGIIAAKNSNDYQYFETLPDNSEQAAEFVDDILKVAENCEQEDKPKYRPVYMTENAITLSDSIQLITRFFGSPEEIHSNYDFVHCTNYWTNWNNTLILRPEALEAILTKELRYQGSKYPLCSIIRTRKFIKRNWTINAGQYLKMCFQLNELDLTDFNVLQEQLIGVDVAYFTEVLEKLKEKGTDKIDSAYLMEIIDRIF